MSDNVGYHNILYLQDIETWEEKNISTREVHK